MTGLLKHGGASRPAPGQILRQRVIGSVLALSLNNPPVNALSAPLRKAIWQALTRAETDTAVRVVVMTGDARLFSAGGDLAELGKAATAPLLCDLCRRIERFAKPVIVALRGQVLGGGLELALAAHYRMADAGAVLGFPEVSLGLVPGAGGTQRLPRLIGAEQALRLILSGQPVSAVEALAMGMVDHVHDSRLMPMTLEFAAKFPAARPTLDQRTGLRDAAAFQEAVRAARKVYPARETSAQARAVECVEAALLLSADQGLALERSVFDDLRASPQSLALRHLFRAERRAGRRPAALAGHPEPRLIRIGVWGAGPDSPELASRALAAGWQVVLADPVRDALVAGLRRIAGHAEDRVAAGQLGAAARDADWARLTSVLTPDGLNGCDLIVTQPGMPALPATIAPQGVVVLGGLPAGGGADCGVGLCLGPSDLIEVALDPEAPPEVALRAVALGQGMGGRVVFTGRGGSVAGRLAAVLADAVELRDRLAAMANAGARMLREGVARCPGDIDVVAVQAGLLPRDLGGPMHQADQRGLLVLRADLERLATTQPLTCTPDPLFNDLIKQGKRLDSLNA